MATTTTYQDAAMGGCLAKLSDLGKHSLCYVWAITMGHLFGETEENIEWCSAVLKGLAGALQLTEEVQETLVEFFHTYTNCEKNEEYLHVIDGCFQALRQDITDMESQPTVLVQELISLHVASGAYDSRIRHMVFKVSQLFKITTELVEQHEQTLVQELRKKQKKDNNDSVDLSESRKKKLKKALVIGLATIGGGTALALSAGLAAPLIGAGAVALLGSSTAVAFTGITGTALITSIFGVAGAGLSGYKMKRRIGKIEQFEFEQLGEQREGLNIGLAISGWLSTDDDSGFHSTWQMLHLANEQYCLKWEGRSLRNLGNALLNFITNQAVGLALKEGLKRTALNVVLKSIAWPLTLIQVSNIIDNPWNTCTYRAVESGKHLATILHHRFHGNRPVSMVGYSLGARVIYHCLLELAQKEGGAGIVEDVYLLGAPVGIKEDEWKSLYKVVGGNIYNCYSRSDWLLKFVYRTASMHVGNVCGLGPVEVPLRRLRNVDLTEIIGGHLEYAETKKMYDVLRFVGVRLNNDYELEESSSEDDEAMLEGCKKGL